MAACFLFAPLCGAQAISAGGARCDSPGLAHGWEARAALRERMRPGPMRRPTGAAGALLARHAEPTGRVCPKFGRKSAASPIRAQFQEAFSARSIGNAPNLTTATQKSRCFCIGWCPLLLSGPAFSRLMVIMFLCAWRLPSFGPQPCASRGSTNQNVAGSDCSPTTRVRLLPQGRRVCRGHVLRG